jgi:hypothetical protein
MSKLFCYSTYDFYNLLLTNKNISTDSQKSEWLTQFPYRL